MKTAGYNANVIYEWELDFINALFDVSVKVGDYYPAQTSGPADICYPAEGGECEIDEISLKTVCFFSEDGKRAIVYGDAPAYIARNYPNCRSTNAEIRRLSDLPKHRIKEIEDAFRKASSDSYIYEHLADAAARKQPTYDDYHHFYDHDD